MFARVNLACARFFEQCRSRFSKPPFHALPTVKKIFLTVTCAIACLPKSRVSPGFIRDWLSGLVEEATAALERDMLRGRQPTDDAMCLTSGTSRRIIASVVAWSRTT